MRQRIIRVANYLKAWLERYDEVRTKERNNRRFEYLLAICLQQIVKGARLLVKLVLRYFRH